jgi:hypothetical protein
LEEYLRGVKKRVGEEWDKQDWEGG